MSCVLLRMRSRLELVSAKCTFYLGRYIPPSLSCAWGNGDAKSRWCVQNADALAVTRGVKDRGVASHNLGAVKCLKRPSGSPHRATAPPVQRDTCGGEMVCLRLWAVGRPRPRTSGGAEPSSCGDEQFANCVPSCESYARASHTPFEDVGKLLPCSCEGSFC